MTDLLRIVVGPLAWLGAFSAVYGLHGIACAFGWAEPGVWGIPLLRLMLAMAWLGAVAIGSLLLVALHAPRLRSPSRFVRRLSQATAWVGLVAMLWTLFPVVATSTCR
ncbi:MAG: hypothetical protein RLO50_04110 [Azospirillaceae bacterium]